MKYQFSKEKLSNQIIELESKEITDDAAGDLNNLYLLSGSSKKIISSLTKQSKEPDLHAVFYMLLPEIEKFVETTNYVNELAPKFMNKLDLSEDECLTLVHDFYKTRDKEIYNAFLKCYNLNKTNLNFVYSEKDEATTYHLINQNESYINVYRNRTINDAVDLAHEFAHATSFQLYNKNILNDNLVLCRELDGTFYQMEFAKFLIKNNIFREEAIKSLMFYNKNMNYEADYLLNYYNFKEIMYVVAYMISIELLNKENKDEIIKQIYSQNPETHEELYNFITDKLYFINNESFQNELRNQYSQIKKLTFSLN